MDDRATIVVGADGSAESRAALAYALVEAARRNATVRVVTAFQPPDYSGLGYGTAPDGMGPRTLEQVTADIEKGLRRTVCEIVAEQGAAVAGVAVDVQALPGTPAKVLIGQARRADLLVVGHRGRGGFTSALLGSVGLQCVLHASCPVTVVRPGPQPGADESPVGSVMATAVPL